MGEVTQICKPQARQRLAPATPRGRESGEIAVEDIPDSARKPEGGDDDAEEKPKKKRAAPKKKDAEAGEDGEEKPKKRGRKAKVCGLSLCVLCDSSR